MPPDAFCNDISTPFGGVLSGSKSSTLSDDDNSTRMDTNNGSSSDEDGYNPFSLPGTPVAVDAHEEYDDSRNPFDEDSGFVDASISIQRNLINAYDSEDDTSSCRSQESCTVFEFPTNIHDNGLMYSSN